MFQDLLGQLSLVAVFVQRVVAFVKPVYKDTQYQRALDIGLSVALSAAVCLSWNVDAFVVAGIALSPIWLGAVVTGLVAGLGANILNDFLALLELWKNQKKLRLATDAMFLNVVDSEDAEQKS